jgi:hypothetical protein
MQPEMKMTGVINSAPTQCGLERLLRHSGIMLFLLSNP